MNELNTMLMTVGDWLQMWPVRAALVLVGALVLNILQRLTLARFARRTRVDMKPWIAAVLKALPSPLALLIWVCAIGWAFQIMERQLPWFPLQIVFPLIGLGFILAVTWFAMRVTNNAKVNLLERAQARGGEVDLTSMDAITKAVIVVIMFAAVVFTLQNFGFSISGLLAFGGLGAVAVGLAAQGMLSNFFGGWMIYLTRPFSIGDWVNSPDRELEGTVEQIGWLQTRIRAFDTRPMYIPNSIFNSIIVKNPSRMQQRLIYETLGVRHVDVKSLGKIIADLDEYLRAHEGVDPNGIVVYFDRMNLNELNFFIWCYARTRVWVEYQRVKQDILLKAAEIIESHGAEIGQPTATINLSGNWPKELNPSDGSGKPARGRQEA